MVKRTLSVEMQDNGTVTAIHTSGLVGTLSLESKGWVWYVYEDAYRQHATAFGSSEQQYEAIGEMLCKMYELTT